MGGVRVGACAVIVRHGALLVVEFHGEGGPRFYLPGGGVEEGESVTDALRREVREETCADVTVGPLLLVTEYYPPRCGAAYGPTHKLSLLFQCTLAGASEPRLPEHPDPHEVAVRWLPLDALPHPLLRPRVGARLLDALAAPPQHSLFCEVEPPTSAPARSPSSGPARRPS